MLGRVGGNRCSFFGFVCWILGVKCLGSNDYSFSLRSQTGTGFAKLEIGKG
jgi:hypothetical protein